VAVSGEMTARSSAILALLPPGYLGRKMSAGLRWAAPGRRLGFSATGLSPAWFANDRVMTVEPDLVDNTGLCEGWPWVGNVADVGKSSDVH
jgi:hypothetical protein